MSGERPELPKLLGFFAAVGTPFNLDRKDWVLGILIWVLSDKHFGPGILFRLFGMPVRRKLGIALSFDT
jgi:hypothetical protein